MRWGSRKQRRETWCGDIVRVLLMAAPVIVGGCARGHDVSDDDTPIEVAGELEALMADGELPSGMTMPPPPDKEPPPPPPRFCSFPTPPIPDDDAGVAEPPVGMGGSPAPLPPSMGPIFAGRGGGSAGAPAAGSGGGEPGIDPACAAVPIGFWNFDDCNEFRTDLQDSSFQGHGAFRTVDLTCRAGQQGLAASFTAKEDLVYVPDQPAFALQSGVSVAAWVKPDAVDRTRTLFRKREDADSAFALLVNQGKFQFVVRLTSGRLVSVVAPARAGRWTHVAGTYDGQYLRLYLDGTQVKQAHAPGVLVRGLGPLLIGNDGSARRFQGRIDNAWFNTLAAPPETIRELTCLHQDPLLTVSPAVGPEVQAGTPVTYTVKLTSQDGPTCAPVTFLTSVGLPQQDFTAEPSFMQLPPLASGGTSTLDVVVRSGTETEAGNYTLSFDVFSQSGRGPIFPPGFPTPGGRAVPPPVSVGVAVAAKGGVAGSDAPPAPGQMEEPLPPVPTGFVSAQADYVVAEPTGCHVTSSKALMIRHIGVVDDPIRTELAGPAGNPNTGAWSFGRLMQDLSPTAAAAPDVTEAVLRSFLTPQTVNGFQIAVRPPMDDLVLRAWPRTADGKLDLARAPVRLLAIANRLDLKDLDHGKAGEGRFVYGVLDPNGFQLEFTIIFEYLLAANDEAGYRSWADAFHALQSLPFPSEEYNAALQVVTERFTRRGALEGAPNGSALIDLRTNEISLSLDGQWQMREFRHSPENGFLVPHPVFQTPDQSFNFTPALGRFINENEASILAEKHEAPLTFEGANFATGAVFNNIDFWDAPGIANPEARHKFSLNTCNGCHGAETSTGFLHVSPREKGQASFLSGFLTGITVFDPITGQQRPMNELARRRKLLESVVCDGQL